MHGPQRPQCPRLDVLILLRLDARAGHFVGVTELSQHLHVDFDLVADRLEALDGTMGLRLRRMAGVVFCAAVPQPQQAAQPCA